MAERNTIYQNLLPLYKDVVNENYFTNINNIINEINIGILGKQNYLIHISDVNLTKISDFLKAFIYDCDMYDKNAVKIWYSESKINNKVFKDLCIKNSVVVCHNLNELINTIKVSDVTSY